MTAIISAMHAIIVGKRDPKLSEIYPDNGPMNITTRDGIKMIRPAKSEE